MYDEIDLSVELKRLRKVCKIQQDFIDGKIDRDSFEKLIVDANCTHILWLEEKVNKMKMERENLNMVLDLNDRVKTINSKDFWEKSWEERQAICANKSICGNCVKD